MSYKSICRACNDTGKILGIWEKPGGIGSGFTPCTNCEKGRAFKSAMDKELVDNIKHQQEFVKNIDSSTYLYDLDSKAYKENPKFNNNPPDQIVHYGIVYLRAESKIKETRPPHPWHKHQWHWLHSERASLPSFSEWLDGRWYGTNGTSFITPEEMARRGWEWFAPAIPPKHPIYDK